MLAVSEWKSWFLRRLLFLLQLMLQLVKEIGLLVFPPGGHIIDSPSVTLLPSRLLPNGIYEKEASGELEILFLSHLLVASYGTKGPGA